MESLRWGAGVTKRRTRRKAIVCMNLRETKVAVLYRRTSCRSMSAGQGKWGEMRGMDWK